MLEGLSYSNKFNLLDTEKALLALILTKKGVIDDIINILKREDFENGENTIHRTVYSLCVQCYERYRYVSIPAVIDEIKNSGVIRLSGAINMDISQYVESLGTMLIRDDNHIGLANILKDASKRRKIFVATADIQKYLLKTPFDNAGETVRNVEKIFQECVSTIERGSEVPVNIYDDIVDAIEETTNQDALTKGLECPYPTIQKIFGSLLRPGNITLFTSRSGVGKALCDTEEVSTKYGGCKPISKLKEGEIIISQDGRETKVKGVYPQGFRKCYRVRWADGRQYTLCDKEHLWTVNLRNGDIDVLRTAPAEKIEPFVSSDVNIYVETSPVEYYHDPGIRGTDGTFYNYGKAFGDSYSNDDGTHKSLQDLPLSTISMSRRLAFMKGFTLGNTAVTFPEGKITQHRYSSYFEKGVVLSSVTSVFTTEELKDAEIFLDCIRSIGGVGIISNRRTPFKRCTKNGYVPVQNAYDVHFISMRLYRELGFLSDSDKDYQFRDYVRISAMEEERSKMPCTCIYVDDESHLYTLKNGVLTHNTQITMDLATKVSDRFGVPVLHFDNGEMSKRELQYRRISSLGKINYYDIESGRWQEYSGNMAKIKNAIAATKGKQLYYYQVAGKEYEEMRDIVKWFYENVAKGGQMIFCFDYLKPPQNGTREDEHKYLGRMLDKFKTLIHDEILVNRKPVISMLTSVQSNRMGVVSKKSSADMDDSENVFGLSDRLIHYASHCAILRNKTIDEIQMEGEEFGTHKLIFVKGRFLGEDPDGYLKMVEMPDGSLRKNSINLEFKNFAVTEKGDLRDVAKSLIAKNSKFKKDDSATIDAPF